MQLALLAASQPSHLHSATFKLSDTSLRGDLGETTENSWPCIVVFVKLELFLDKSIARQDALQSVKSTSVSRSHSFYLTVLLSDATSQFNNSNSNRHDSVTVLSLWHNHYESSAGSFDEWRTAPDGCWSLDQDKCLVPLVCLNRQL